MTADDDESDTLTVLANVFSPRWGHEDTYTITLTRTSLYVALDTRAAECVIHDNGEAEWRGYRRGIGNPLLALFANDSIYAPAVVPEALVWILGKWHNQEASRDEISTAIQELFSWINLTGRQKPASQFWKEYF